MSNETTTPRPIVDVVRDIASHLPDGWQTVDAPYDHAATIVGPAGERIYVRRESYGADRGRLTLSGGTPDGASYADGDTRGVDTGRITVAGHRDPAAIAREIVRRLMPTVLAAHHEISGRIAQRETAASVRGRVIDELARRMGGRAVGARGSRDASADTPDMWRGAAGGRRYTYGHMTPDYDGDTVAVELRGLSVDHARELADMVAVWVAADRDA